MAHMRNFTFAGTPAWHGRTAELVWAAAIGGRALSSGTISVAGVVVAQGSTGLIAVFGVAVPQVAEAATVTVRVTVALHLAGTAVAANHWDLAVFPPRATVAAAAAAAARCPVPVFAEPALLSAARQVCPNATAASPQTLAGQTTPFVLLRQGGLPDDATAAALTRTGSFAVLLNPAEAGSWPVCSGGSSAVRPPTTVPLSQPWWLSNDCWPSEQSWMTGTLVYNTSLATRTFGTAAVNDGFLAYNFGRVVNGSQVYTLDTLSADVGALVHVRAIPSDGMYAGSGYETMVANSALVWEGRVPASTHPGSGSGGSGGGGRFLVSGLNLFDGPALRPDAVAEHVFGQLLAYAVAETAVATAGRAAPGALAHGGCNISGSFCTVGSEQPCRQPSSGSQESLCNANFEIAVPACLQRGGTLDALHLQVLVRSAGTRIVGLVYDTAAPAAPGANASFCAAAPNSTAPGPRRLVAKGTAVAVAAAGKTWLRLPLPATPLAAGIYWIGILADADLSCYSGAPAALPAIGPGSLDSYAPRPFAEGPGLGPELRWTAGQGGLSLYATTTATPAP